MPLLRVTDVVQTTFKVQGLLNDLEKRPVTSREAPESSVGSSPEFATRIGSGRVIHQEKDSIHMQWPAGARPPENSGWIEPGITDVQASDHESDMKLSRAEENAGELWNEGHWLDALGLIWGAISWFVHTKVLRPRDAAGKSCRSIWPSVLP